VFTVARNNELSTSCKYEMGRIMRYVEQQSSSFSTDRNTSVDLNQLNVNRFVLFGFTVQLVISRINYFVTVY